MAKDNRYRIDWPELKSVALRLIEGNTSDFKRANNQNSALGYVQGGSWDGFTKGQLERWLREGYKTDMIHGLEDFIPPVREKRKFVFAEEGDEFHFDIAAGGDDNYMSRFTKRDEIPGLGIDVEIGMSAGNNAAVLNAYYTWLCRVCFAVESAGIDTEVTLRYAMERYAFRRDATNPYTTVIRVKQENEATDFLSWSPMLSPASFRSLMFIANTLHAESRGHDVNSGQGQRLSGRWGVKFIPETRTLSIGCPWNDHSFPEEHMTNQLREALREATNVAGKQ
jgi:hypothetical protein